MTLPLDHLSASSVSLFLRCPRQFQEQYIRGSRGPSNSALVIGSAVHLALSRELKGEPRGKYFKETVDRAMAENGEIEWKYPESYCQKRARTAVDMYMKRVAPSLNVLETEKEILIELPGIDIPILGYVDIVTDRGVIDIKTTGYVNRKISIQPAWKLQMNVYQLEYPTHGEFHVITNSASYPLVIPDSRDHPFCVAPVDNMELMLYLARIYKVMESYYEMFGEEDDWPGNVTHDWAAKYCPLGEKCCQRM